MAKQKQVEGQMSFADFLALQTPEAAVSDYDTEKSNDQAQSQTADVSSVSSDDARFEEEFARLSALFERVRSDDFDAMQYLSPIANAVKTSIAEEISFSEALERHCSSMSAGRILAAFTGDTLKELITIIGGMHDEI